MMHQAASQGAWELTKGRYRMQDFLRRSQTSYVPLDSMDGPEDIFKNVNSPDDLIY